MLITDCFDVRNLSTGLNVCLLSSRNCAGSWFLCRLQLRSAFRYFVCAAAFACGSKAVALFTWLESARGSLRWLLRITHRVRWLTVHRLTVGFTIGSIWYAFSSPGSRFRCAIAMSCLFVRKHMFLIYWELARTFDGCSIWLISPCLTSTSLVL